MEDFFRNLPPDLLAGASGEGEIPSASAREQFLAGTIISFSGWRRVFAADSKGESACAEISPAAALFASATAASFTRWMRHRCGRDSITVAVSTDTRPTGPAIAFNVMRAILAEGASVRWLSASAIPEALAYTRIEEGVDGLLYITASHNPLGHNGFKFAAKTGGVLDPAETESLKKVFLQIFLSESELRRIKERIQDIDLVAIKAVFDQEAGNKKKSLAAYRSVLDRAVSGARTGGEAQDFLAGLRSRLRERAIGVVAELNGSSRTCSLDVDYLNSLGVRVKVVNGEPGAIRHAILPEGEALLPCCRALEEAAAQDPSFELGYVPDNDGDRGNVVIIDESGRAHPLEAQEVFALAVAAELSFYSSAGLAHRNHPGAPPVAVVVNDPTSGRVDRIAGLFGAELFRAEVGEANIVELARQLRERGYIVPILGEGSNGGNITPPSLVRDPLSTVLAFIKLARLEMVSAAWFAVAPGIKATGLPGRNTLADIVRTLPKYFSTALYEQRSLVKIRSGDHDRLKSRYEEIFSSRWPEFEPELSRRMGITGYRIVQYEGTRTIHGPSQRSRGGQGGFKVILTGRDGREIGFLWMRDSKTEPVFRVMADISTSREDEKYLLELHRGILVQADNL